MTISLSDLPIAVADYLDTQVTVEVVKVTTNLGRGGVGTFTVRATNADAPAGVRLVDVVYHVTIDAPSVVKLKVPQSAIIVTRASTNASGAVLTGGSLVDAMVVFPDAVTGLDVLDPGAVNELELEYEAEGTGQATIKCHLHARVDEASLFPGGENTPNGSHNVRVV